MARDLSRSRAILIGIGTFADRKRLPDLPAAGCVSAMADLLAGELCGWPADRIVTLQDIASPSDLARRIMPAGVPVVLAEKPTDIPLTCGGSAGSWPRRRVRPSG
ncbi:MAG: hypothetical protein ACLPKE_35515 [Streptosporangiaceae bacterium]